MFFGFFCIIAIVLLVVAIYEIVSSENYSLNELKSFIKINGYYLKEIEDEQ